MAMDEVVLEDSDLLGSLHESNAHRESADQPTKGVIKGRSLTLKKWRFSIIMASIVVTVIVTYLLLNVYAMASFKNDNTPWYMGIIPVHGALLLIGSFLGLLLGIHFLAGAVFQ